MNNFPLNISKLMLAFLVSVLLSAGCGKENIKLSADQKHAFDNAPPEAKSDWEKALAADQANDYVNVQNLLDSLQQMSLTDPQNQALQIEADAFHQRLWEAAEKNDPAATKAALEINKSKKSR